MTTNLGWTALRVIPVIDDAKKQLEDQIVKPAEEAGRKAGTAAGGAFAGGFKANIKGAALALGGLLLSAQAARSAFGWVQESIAAASKARGGSAFDELAKSGEKLQLAFGTGLVDSFEETTSKGRDLLGVVDDLAPAMQEFGSVVGQEIGDVAKLAGVVGLLTGEVSGLLAALPGGSEGPFGKAFDFVKNGPVITGLALVSDGIDRAREGWYRAFGDPAQQQAEAAARPVVDLTNKIDGMTRSEINLSIQSKETFNGVAIEAQKAWFSVDRLNAALDEANGKNRSRAGARSALAETWLGLASMGGKDAKGNPLPFDPAVKGGKLDRSTASGNQAMQWILGLADSVDARVKTRFDQGDVAGAQLSLDANRRRLTDLLRDWDVKRPAAFANRFLATPDYLPQAAQSSAAVERHLTGAGVDRTPQVVFTGPNYFRDEQAAARRAQEVAVLQRGSHGQIPAEALS